MYIFLFLLGVTFLAIIGLMFTRSKEFAEYNEGQCQCGGEWISFDTDSQRGTGWACDKCGETLWTSWIKSE